MSKQLTLDEMLECLIEMEHPSASALQTALESLGSAIAQLIATTLNVDAGPATFQGVALSGTCAPFTPHFRGQPCPQPLRHFDPREWDDDQPPILDATGQGD